MSRRRPPNEAPYSQTLSALRKNDLIRLCVELGLSVDGSVVTLRTRLKDHITLNRATMHRNPRYTALFPKHRRTANPPSSPSRSSFTPTSRASPVAPPSRSLSPTHSFASWHGIDEEPIHPADEHQRFSQEPFDYIHPDELAEPPLPPPSPPPSPPPLVPQVIGGREFFIRFSPR
jgi:hypothetical protein